MGGAVDLFAWNDDKDNPSLLVQKIVYAPVKKVQTTPPTGKTVAKLPSKPFTPAQQFLFPFLYIELGLAASIEEEDVAIKEFDTLTKLKEARVNAMRSAI
ncbi:hypothetical protein M8C21_010972 [Ambrosia artemisiifolia]|uniref:Uncharacterized protein n=1 Tax=Ambrosia artemisiifolia TaxID=4212 RepID=A0AAD5BQI5_AMBAR|nr:hypothetical protein M8C21_010972 [Ambrosia artemisiifolia]